MKTTFNVLRNAFARRQKKVFINAVLIKIAKKLKPITLKIFTGCNDFCNKYNSIFIYYSFAKIQKIDMY